MVIDTLMLWWQSNLISLNHASYNEVVFTLIPFLVHHDPDSFASPFRLSLAKGTTLIRLKAIKVSFLMTGKSAEKHYNMLINCIELELTPQSFLGGMFLLNHWLLHLILVSLDLFPGDWALSNIFLSMTENPQCTEIITC